MQMTTRHVLPNTPKVVLKENGHSSDLEKKGGVLTLAHKPHGLWSRAAEEMMNTFVAIWHPVLRGTSLLSRGPLKSNGGGEDFNTFQCGT